MTLLKDEKIKESNRNIKIRKQGNSQSLTVPYDFNIPEGQTMKPILTRNGIYYEFIDEEDKFFNFDADILQEILADKSIPREEIAEEFVARKAAFPQQVKSFTEDALKTGKVMTKEEFGKAIGL